LSPRWSKGRLRKALGEITLAGQAFVKDLDVTIEKLLKGAKAEVVAFERFEVGAGIEKKPDGAAPRSGTEGASIAQGLKPRRERGFFHRGGVEMTQAKAHYSRIVVKLSGEALMGEGNYGIDPAVIRRIAGNCRTSRR